MKIIVLFLILYFNSIAQVDTSKILLRFNERMGDWVELTKASNYKITDPNNVRVTVYKVGRVPSNDSTQVVIFCKRIDYKKTYKVVVSNVKDWSGNLIDPLHNKTTFIFKGITTDMPIPSPELRK